MSEHKQSSVFVNMKDPKCNTHEMPNTGREEVTPPSELAEPSENNPSSGERDRSGPQQPMNQ